VVRSACIWMTKGCGGARRDGRRRLLAAGARTADGGSGRRWDGQTRRPAPGPGEASGTSAALTARSQPSIHRPLPRWRLTSSRTALHRTAHLRGPLGTPPGPEAQVLPWLSPHWRCCWRCAFRRPWLHLNTTPRRHDRALRKSPARAPPELKGPYSPLPALHLPCCCPPH